MAKKVMKRGGEEVEKQVNENRTEGKSKMIVSCGFLEEELRGNAGSRFANQSQELGRERKSEKKEV